MEFEKKFIDLKEKYETLVGKVELLMSTIGGTTSRDSMLESSFAQIVRMQIHMNSNPSPLSTFPMQNVPLDTDSDEVMK